MKNDPKYVRFQKKHTLLDHFYMNLMYSRYARTVLDCEKRLFLRYFMDETDTPSWHSSTLGFSNGFFKSWDTNTLSFCWYWKLKQTQALQTNSQIL